MLHLPLMKRWRTFLICDCLSALSLTIFHLFLVAHVCEVLEKVLTFIDDIFGSPYCMALVLIRVVVVFILVDMIHAGSLYSVAASPRLILLRLNDLDT